MPRRSGLRDRRPVHELHHGVDHLLRVHDHVDPVERDVEQQVRLDDLEPLVDEGGRVGRDHPPHREVRVRQCLLRGDLAQRLTAAATEGSTARSHDQSPHLLGAATAKALRDRRVLRVHRDDLVRLRRCLDQRSADDERLLVGQRQRGPLSERRQRRAQPDGAGDPVEDDVGAAPSGRHRSVRPDHDLGPVCRAAGSRGIPTDRLSDLLVGAVRDRDEIHLEGDGLLGHEVEVGAGRQGDHTEAVQVACDDVQGLGADGAGGAEDGDAARGCHWFIVAHDRTPAVPPAQGDGFARLPSHRSTATRTAPHAPNSTATPARLSSTRTQPRVSTSMNG